MKKSALPKLALPLALALSWALFSCSSTASAIATNDRSVPLYGMVYDDDNSPVAGAEVLIDGKAKTKSDVNGRFVLTALKFGQYAVVVKKDYFEPARLDLDYSSATQVLYVKLVSEEELLAAADKDIAAREWAKADDHVARALALKRDDPAALFLSAVIACRRGDSPDAAGAAAGTVGAAAGAGVSAGTGAAAGAAAGAGTGTAVGAAAARTILEKLLAADYREPAVYLFLTDILQYKYADAAGAAERLKEYLELRYDPDAEARLQALLGK